MRALGRGNFDFWTSDKMTRKKKNDTRENREEKLGRSVDLEQKSVQDGEGLRSGSGLEEEEEETKKKEGEEEPAGEEEEVQEEKD